MLQESVVRRQTDGEALHAAARSFFEGDREENKDRHTCARTPIRLGHGANRGGVPALPWAPEAAEPVLDAWTAIMRRSNVAPQGFR